MDHEKRVVIHRFGEVGGISLDDLSGGIAAAYRVGVVGGLSLPLPALGYDRKRRQYPSRSFLDALADIGGSASQEAGPPGAAPAHLGITAADLFAPRLNFVFGEADAQAGVAIVSVYRLRPEFYGEEPDLARFRDRALKEAVHELGHVFGLPHCQNQYCIMRFSNSIADTDRKGPGFCQECLVRLATHGLGRSV